MSGSHAGVGQVATAEPGLVGHLDLASGDP